MTQRLEKFTHPTWTPPRRGGKTIFSMIHPCDVVIDLFKASLSSRPRRLQFFIVLQKWTRQVRGEGMRYEVVQCPKEGREGRLFRQFVFREPVKNKNGVNQNELRFSLCSNVAPLVITKKCTKSQRNNCTAVNE